MTLKQILDQVRADAGIKGANSLTGLIITQWNRIAREYTARRKYPELFQPGLLASPSGVNDNVFLLQNNVQHLIFDSVSFTEGGDPVERYPILKSARWLGPTTGLPQRYIWKGGAVEVFPYESIDSANSRLVYDAYVYPQPLVAASDVWSIPALESTILHEVVAMVSRQTDSDIMTSEMRNVERSYSASWAIEH